MESTVASDCTITQPFGSSASIILSMPHVPLYSINTCSGKYCMLSSFSFAAVNSSSESISTTWILAAFSLSISYSTSPSSHIMISPFEPLAKSFSKMVSLISEVLPLSMNPVNKYTGISSAILLVPF